MQIYKLLSSQTEEVYVGKTTETLEDRFRLHKCDYRKWLDGRRQFKYSYFLTEYEDCKIELIEKTNNSLREIYWIRKLNTCNFEHNGDDYFIYKKKRKDCKQGFLYVFQIQRNRKTIVKKTSVNKEVVIKFRDEYIKNNPEIFME